MTYDVAAMNLGARRSNAGFRSEHTYYERGA